MRNILLVAFVALFFVGCKNDSSTSFEGMIEYKITYTKIPADMEPFVNMMPKTKTIYIKDGKIREEKPIGIGTQIMVMDSTSGSRLLLMEVGGKKLLTEIPAEIYQQMEAGDEDITYNDETKEILGYTCHKALVWDRVLHAETIVFYTDKIPAWADKTYKKLKGFPLYYQAVSDGLFFEVEAVKVEEKELDDAMFTNFSDYKRVSMDELQMAISGGF